jgi:glutathione S-transferase
MTLTLFQAEWCPYSAAVRERLTELGVDVLLRQVEPWPDDRDELAAAAGVRSIPTLVADGGEVVSGVEAIFAWLDRLEPGDAAAEHRARYREHAGERRRELTAEVLDRLAPEAS